MIITELNYQISDIVKADYYKTGNVKIRFPKFKEKIYCKILLDLGFGLTKINNKEIYFRGRWSNIKYFTFYEIKDEFAEYLRTEFKGSIFLNDVLREFYWKNPIKQNDLFKAYMTIDELSGFEETELLSQLKDEKRKSEAKKSYYNWLGYTHALKFRN